MFVSNVCNAMCVLFRKNSLIFLSDPYGKKLSSREVNSHFYIFILLPEKFLPFDWLRAEVFQLNLKYLHV